VCAQAAFHRAQQDVQDHALHGRIIEAGRMIAESPLAPRSDSVERLSVA
jgi:hypothetical protein